MKKIKFLGAALLAASLIFSGCANGSDDDVSPEPAKPAVENPTDTTGTDTTDGTDAGTDEGTDNGSETNNGGETSGGDTAGGDTNAGGDTTGGGDTNAGDTDGGDTGTDNGGDTDTDDEDNDYEAPAIDDYFKYYLVSSPAQSTNKALGNWGDGTTATPNGDGTYEVHASGSMWGGNAGVCMPFSGLDEGCFSKYEYIVFNVDIADFEIVDGEGNKGVNVKLAKGGTDIGNQQKVTTNYVKNGTVRTYYAPLSMFGTEVPLVANEMAIIIGGEGTVQLNQVYLASETDPSSIPVTSITASVNDNSVLAGTSVAITVKDSNLTNITSQASFTIAEGDTTGSAIVDNVFTAGAEAGDVTINVSWEEFSTTITLTVITSKDYAKYFKKDSVKAEASLVEEDAGYMALWFDGAINISEATASETEYSITRENADGPWYGTQFFYKENAGTYDVSFKIMSTSSGDITINNEVISLTADEEYEYTTTKTLGDFGTLLSIQLGKNPSGILPAGTFTISDFSVTPASAAE